MITLVPSNDENYFVILNPLTAKFVRPEKYIAVPVDQLPSLMRYGWRVFALGVVLTLLSGVLIASGLPTSVGSVSMGLGAIVSSAMVLALSIKVMTFPKMKLEPDFTPASFTKIWSFRAVMTFCFLALASGVLLAVI